MSKHVARAVLTALGAQITWEPPHDGLTEATIVNFVDELRRIAIRRPENVASAVVQDMDEHADYAPGSSTVITVDSLGTAKFQPELKDAAETPQESVQDALVDDDAAPSALPPQAPEPKPERATPPSLAPTVTDIVARPQRAATPVEDLFGQSFVTQQTQIAMLPEATVVTANTKGGAGKTPLAVTIAAAAAHLAGHNDVAIIDTNPSGNLTERTLRSSTADIHALAEAAADLDFGKARPELDPYINWQPGGWFTVNCPQSLVGPDGTLIPDLTAADIGNIVRALRHHCRFLMVDTGNNSKDVAWQAVTRHADTILIPIQWEPATVIEAQKMVKNMADAGHHRLKERVIFVGTHAPKMRPRRQMEREYRQALTGSGWRVMDLPADRHIARGGVIEWDKLRQRTREGATNIVRAINSRS